MTTKPAPINVAFPPWLLLLIPIAYIGVNLYDEYMILIHKMPRGHKDLEVLHFEITLLTGLMMYSYGLLRCSSRHPAANSKYRAWLELSPWNDRLPLPLGPAHLGWQDALVVLLVVGCVALDSWRFKGILYAFLGYQLTYIVCAFGLGYVSGACSVLKTSGQWLEVWAPLVGLPLIVFTFLNPELLLALMAVLVGLANVGVVRSLRRFPWPREEERPKTSWLGWPFNELGPAPSGTGLRRGLGLVAGVMIGWWAFAFAHGFDLLLHLSGDRFSYDGVGGICLVAGIVLAIVRLGVYCGPYHWPMGPIARLRTGNLFFPGYDYVFLAPLATFLLGNYTPRICQMLNLPPTLGLGIGLAATTSAALELGPRFNKWRLTGTHHPSAAGLRLVSETR